MENAVLVLEDGKVFHGQSFGSNKESLGEVVFNTGMTGYQELLTDPSYTGQIVVMTYPIIGNYGINEEDVESSSIKVKGLIVKEYCEVSGNWKHTESLGNYLTRNDIPAICGIDTRSLTRYIRSKGTLKGIISNNTEDIQSLVDKAKLMKYDEECSIADVGTKTAYHIDGTGYKVAVLDFGLKENIIRYLTEWNFDITVLPAKSTLEEILKTGCEGVLLSNGPGDPKTLPSVVEVVKELVKIMPVFGICLGHQILGLALGADTYKLRFGHRGVNHPVKDLVTNKVYITSQNHGFAIDADSIKGLDLEVTHINLNDQTVEGIRHTKLPVFSVQYHPEAAPGPRESRYLFEQFFNNIKNSKADNK